jgi:serine/threonine protein kinase
MLTPDTILQGRYLVVRQLGQGGMGAVYESVDQRLDTTVALKETLFTDERLRKQFEREARLLARLHHPALPRVSDHFSEAEGQFLVMQFIPGDDLAEMMARKRGPFPADQVLQWADQLLDALDYLHTQEPQIVHRDIKPQNLKLTSRGQVILLDFGLAKGQAGDISRVTTSASIFGYTPNYAPLEQIQGLGTDSRSDLYSLGATLYHLMTGVKPPDALTRAAALVNGQPDPLVLASEANSAVSPEVDGVLAKAMAQSREQRYASAADMRRALHGTDQAATVINRGEAQTVLFPPGAPTVAATTKHNERQPTVATGETTVVRSLNSGSQRRILPWALAAAAIVVLAFGAFAYYNFQKKSVAVVQLAPTTPTPAESPSLSGSGSTSTVTPAERTPSTAKVEESKEPKVTPKKTEPKPTHTEPAKKNKTADEDAEAPDSMDHDDEVPTPATPKGPIVFGKRPGQRGQTIQVGPNIIRNFPDGSQMITTPDGTRIYRTPDGRSQVLRPGEKPNRRRVPPSP